ncbi:RagB/SusD family nutrient uptake outer membrane protein [Flectobacillus major]|uniref:RagB/SusD family nutrient uptake outer membrane protein n=1 Tax=Flectobacillus major TaxID=103 RepID=UPI0003FEBAAD|nr:RagB/SusD family nutrient uptake outer membrane protein [Flectobacillus major]
MKKYTILKPLFIFFTICGLASSCTKDFLERPPLSNLTAGTFFNTDAELLASTGALYNQVWAGANGQSLLAFGDGRGGNFFTPYVADWLQFCSFAVSNTNGALKDSWSSFYNIIAQSNVLISNVNTYSKPAVSQAAKKTAIGEARYMRGLAYSFLVQNWGPVPIITDNIKQGGDTTLSRNTVESVWEFAIRDMQYAVANLPVSTTGGRLSKYSAEGMLARFYLTRAGLGSTNGQRNQMYLDSAKYYARDVIQNSPYKLMENYADLFFTKNNNNSEQLFGLQWVPLRDPWGVGNTFQSQFAANSTITGGADGWGGGHGASADYILNLDPLDSLRRKATFMFPGDHYPELNKKGGGWTQGIPDAGTYSNLAHFKKYIVGSPDDNDGKGQMQATGNNTYMQRLADVYLIYAEAILGNNTSTADPEALKYFNAVRNRAGLPSVTSFNIDKLLHERRYEFAVEGDAWYDIIRLYYYNPTKAKAMINAQQKGDYKLEIKPGTYAFNRIREFTITIVNPRTYTVSDATMFLPYPDTEMAMAPNLRKPPVPYKF